MGAIRMSSSMTISVVRHSKDKERNEPSPRRRLASYPKHDLKPDYEGFAFCAALRAAEAGHRPAMCAPDYSITPETFSTSFMSPVMPHEAHWERFQSVRSSSGR